MPIIGGDSTSYKVRPIQSRVDGDGKESVLVRAHGDLTAKKAYVAYPSYDGWRTAALFDTGLASATANLNRGFIAAIPISAIGSDTDGWVQCGGPITGVTFDSASTSASVGNHFIWNDATVTGAAIGAGPSAANAWALTYGICMSSGSGATHDVYLLGSNHKFTGFTT